jgi:mRNA interferase MazF
VTVSKALPRPKRGEVWYATLDPTLGHEQAGRRPVLIVSADKLNSGPWRLSTVLPITSKDRRDPSRVALTPPTGGLSQPSWVITDQCRTITQDRLVRPLGRISDDELASVARMLRLFLGL